MKTEVKKLLIIILAALFCAAVFCGCGIESGPVTLEESIQIPEDGIISADTLKKLKDENKAVTFTGKSGSVEYQWIVFGNCVEEAKDTNLKVEVTEDKDGNLAFRLCSEEELPLKAQLSIRSNNLWTEEMARMYKDGTELSDSLQPVTLSGKEKTVLSIPTPEPGSYVVKGEAVPEEGGKEGSGGAVDTYGCTVSIECSTILNNLKDLGPDKLDCVPGDGYLLYPVYVEFTPGESAYDVLQRICSENGIHMESAWTPLYNSNYIEGIGNLYEFDCGSGSGWMYRVNGWYPNFGSSAYTLEDGDVVEWRYTCDIGADIGGGNMVGGK